MAFHTTFNLVFFLSKYDFQIYYGDHTNKGKNKTNN